MRLPVTVKALIAALALIAMASPIAFAVQPDEILDDPVLEAQAREISAELRCLVCQNQSIDDSDAPLAHDLRLLVRERLKAGDDEQAVIDFIVARYGEFVLLRPRFSAKTYLLWLAPLLLLGGGGYLAFRLFARPEGESVAHPAPLSREEEEQLQRIFDESKG